LSVDINPARLLRDLADLSAIGGRPDGGVDRVAWSPADLEARAWLRARLEDFGWHSTADAALSVFGRASVEHRPRLLIGSHTDSVPAGGRLDGAYGVVAALEVVRTLVDSGDPTADHVELVDFADEEGVRFQCGYFGSKALVGTLEPGQLAEQQDASGFPAADILRAAGVKLEELASASEHLQHIAGYLELHIEQGPRLERERASVGVVPGILGFDRYLIEIKGVSVHGGTTPLSMRQDPSRAAAEFIAAVPGIVERIDDAGTATVGTIRTHGGAINFVPGRVTFSLEVRQSSTNLLSTTVDAIKRHLAALCSAYGCDLSIAPHDSVIEEKDGVKLAVEPAYAAPVAFDQRLVDGVERACVEAGVAYRRLHAGTWHDAAIIAPHVPTAMILVPSRGGVTHSPAEDTEPDDIVNGARVLLRATRYAVSALSL
jgi:N-carbamoyl-L-amino-acid hydrolase